MTLDFFRPAAMARFRGTTAQKRVLDVQKALLSVAESNLGRVGLSIESFIDELATQAGVDQLNRRLALLSHEPSRKVL